MRKRGRLMGERCGVMKKIFFIAGLLSAYCLYGQSADDIVKLSRDRIKADTVQSQSTMVLTAKNGSKSERTNKTPAALLGLRRYFDRRYRPGADDLVWVGDLNVAPLALDVYDSRAVWPHVCHCREVIDAFAGVVAWGFADVFRKHIPGPGAFTFWDYRQRGSLERNRGWRIDHILASRGMAERSADCAVDVEPRRARRPSDHTFVYADFNV